MSWFDDIIVGRPIVPFFWPTQSAIWRSNQAGVRSALKDIESTTDADERRVAVSIVHSREDGAALLIMQTHLHKQLVNISRGVWLLALLAIYFGNRAFE